MAWACLFGGKPIFYSQKEVYSMPDKKNKGKKPMFVYVSEELHKTLTELASEKEGGTLSSLVREVLVEYVKKKTK